MRFANAEGIVAFTEDFEQGNAQGWTMTGSGSAGLTGLWIIGDPNGTVDPSSGQPAQPENAFAGAGCAFTAQNASPGVDDVDEGVVRLMSPPLDLSSSQAATLEYDRWFFNQITNNDTSDRWTVEAREGPAWSWVELERVGDDTSANAWTHHAVALDQFITLTATVQVRFSASDGAWPAPQDIIEAALDNVLITVAGCAAPEDCEAGQYCDTNGMCADYGGGDFDSDGDVDLEDYGTFETCFGQSGTGPCTEANLTGDIAVTLEDYAEFAARLTGPE